eukprot:6911156-Prymnesium_polylepis.1
MTKDRRSSHPPVVSINRYLAREESKGPDEEGVEYTRSNLDMIYCVHVGNTRFELGSLQLVAGIKKPSH